MQSRLYAEISRLPISDRYAIPRKTAGVITNITELIRRKEIEEILSFFDWKRETPLGKASDFEYFNELCKKLPYLKGTKLLDLLCVELALFCDSFDGENVRLSSEQIRQMWHEANEKIVGCFDGSIKKTYGIFNVEKLYRHDDNRSPRIYDEKDKKSPLIDSDTYDLAEFDFIRPDPYHSEMLRDRIIRGEKLNNNEISLLSFQDIYLKFLQNKSGKMQLHLRFGRGTRTAENLISYLKLRGLRGEIFLGCDGETSAEAVAYLCSMSDGNINVRPEIVLTRTDSYRNLKNRLSLLAGAYPVEKLRFGGAVTDSPLFFAEHFMFRKALSEVLCEIYGDVNEALDTAKKIIL